MNWYYRFAVYKNGKLLFKAISTTEHGAYMKFVHEIYDRNLDMGKLKQKSEYSFIATYSKLDNIELAYNLGFKDVQTNAEKKKHPNLHEEYLTTLQKRYGSKSNLNS